MARINRISITLCALLFTTLPLTPMAHASKQARESSATTHITKKADKKKSTATTQKTQKASQKTAKKAASKSTTKSKTASSVKKSSITASKNGKTRSKHAVNKTASASFTEKCTKRKGYKSHCVKVKNAASGTLADAHKAKVQKATKVAMNKLMQQIGKPYRWGGSSPRTGFDCSGLVQWCYGKAGISLPRTAQAQYDATQHLPLSQAKAGDLVFFHSTYNAGTYVTHVGIYAGNNRMYHAGDPIGYADLTSSYWQQHLIGAGRVKTN